MQPMKTLRSFLAAFALSTLVFTASSCSDSTAPAPVQQSESQDLASGLLFLGNPARVVDTTVTALQRLVPLSGDVTRSAVIGPSGGLITIPEAGFTLVVPWGAVDAPTTISVTAVQGSTAAYEFEPHGMTFDRPLVFLQDLGVTSAVSGLLGTTFTGGYFQSRDDISPTGTAVVHELVPARVGFLSRTVGFPIQHFSGYLVAVD